VSLERSVQRVTQSLGGETSIGAGGVATAKSAVDRLIRVQKEAVPREIVVEFEAAQVDALDLDQTDPDELVGDVGDVLVETNNLLVDGRAVASGLAPEDEEDRLARPSRLGLRGGIIAEPAVFGGLELARLGIGNAGQQEQGHPGEDAIHG